MDIFADAPIPISQR
jgi:hypothetical protein